MIVRWTRQAINDRALIFDYLAERNPFAALAIDRSFEHSATQLTQFPHSGRIGLVAGTRELLPHPSYRLVYEIGNEQVTILTIVHTSRLWPPAEDE